MNASELKLSYTRFNGKANLTHTGDKSNSSAGGCYYSDSVLIIHQNATGGNFFTGTAVVDTFSAPVTIRNAQKGKIGVVNAVFMDKARFENYSVTANSVGGFGSGTPGQTFLVADAGTCTFQDTLTLDNDTAATSFGTSGGSVIFEEDATLNALSSYYGDLILSNITKNNETETNIDFSNNPGILALDTGNIFSGTVTCKVQRVRLNNSTYNNDFTLTRTSSYTDTCKGGNFFARQVVITDTNSTAVNLILAFNYPDVFEGSVTFRHYGSGQILPCHTKNSSFKGDIITDGTKSVSFGNNGGRVIIEGEADHIFSKLGSYQPVIKKLEMKKDARTFTLTVPITVTDSVFFTKGFLVTDSANLLKILDNGVVTCASDSSFVIGSVKKTGNEIFTFPLGIVDGEGSGFYHPLTISAPSSATDAFTARYLYQNHNLGLVTDTAIENPSLCEHWKLQRDTGTSNVTVKLGWNTNSCNVFGLDSMHVAVWDTASDKWLDKGNGGTTGNIAVGTVVTDSALSIFGVMTLADKFCTSLNNYLAKTPIRCKGGTNGSAIETVSGATPPYTYSWSASKGIHNSALNFTAGTYTVVITDSRGCCSIDTVVFSEPDSLILTFSNTSSSCGDSTGTATIVASGGASPYRYLWSEYGGNDSIADSLVAGTYVAIVTDSLGCIQTATVPVSDSNGPTAYLSVLSDVKCSNGSDGKAKIVVSSGNPPFTYDWIESANTDSIDSTLTAGIHVAIVIDANGCRTVVSDTIVQPDTLEVTVSSTLSHCATQNGTALANVSGGIGPYTYLWLPSAGTDSLEDSLASGIDTVFVTDGNGCIEISSVFISDSLAPTATASVVQNISCMDSNDGIVRVSISGGLAPYTYLWLPDSTTNDTAFNLTPGIYDVFVSDSNGCKTKDSIFIDSPAKFDFSIYGTNASAPGASDGSVGIYAIGGTPPYSYLWSPGSATTAQITGLFEGDYMVTITDSEGCTEIGYVQITSTGCSNPCDATTNSCPPPPSPYPSPPHSFSVKNIVTDFYADSTGATSSQCAFEAAVDYFRSNTINGVGGNGILFIPKGTFIVGRQQQSGVYYLKGHEVLCFEGITDFTIDGRPPMGGSAQRAIIKFEDCMRFGSFDPVSGDRWLGTPPGCTLSTQETDYNNYCYVCTTPGSCTPCLHTNLPCTACPSCNVSPCPSPDPTHYVDCANLCGPSICPNCTTISCQVGGPPYYPVAASIGNCIQFQNSTDIEIRNLELDGNSDNIIFGGGFADGIQLPHDGIFLNSCTSVLINNVSAHHFGRDGIGINDSYNTPAPNSYPPQHSVVPMDIKLIGSKFEWNGRNGMSWDGGYGVTAINCEFNYSAQARLYSHPGDGLDIEWENCNNQVEEGYFEDCKFLFNKNYGIETNAQNSGYHFWNHNFYFNRCTVVGAENGLCLKPNSIGFLFENCNFHGVVQQAYNATNCAVCDPWPWDFTQFNNCTFDDEYDNLFSINANSVNLCPIGPTCVPFPNSNARMYSFLGCGRMRLNSCTFSSGYSTQLGIMHGGYNTPNHINLIKASGCSFWSFGMNVSVGDNSGGCNACSADLGQIFGIWFQGNTEFHYLDFGLGLINEPFPSACGGANYWVSIGTTTVVGTHSHLHDIPSSHPCLNKYFDGYSNLVDLYSSSCSTCTVFETPICPPCSSCIRISPPITYKKTQPYKIYPVPTKDLLTIEGEIIDRHVLIRNVFGQIVYSSRIEKGPFHVDTSRLPAGIYIIEVRGESAKKFIKL